MANGITDTGQAIRPITGVVVETDENGLYNGTRVQYIAEYDWDTGLPTSGGTGTANGIATDGRRIQPAVLTPAFPDTSDGFYMGFYAGTRVHFVALYDWNTGAPPEVAEESDASASLDLSVPEKTGFTFFYGMM